MKLCDGSWLESWPFFFLLCNVKHLRLSIDHLAHSYAQLSPIRVIAWLGHLLNHSLVPVYICMYVESIYLLQLHKKKVAISSISACFGNFLQLTSRLATTTGSTSSGENMDNFIAPFILYVLYDQHVIMYFQSPLIVGLTKKKLYMCVF